MLYDWIACHVNEWAGYNSLTRRPTICLMLQLGSAAVETRRDGIYLPPDGNTGGINAAGFTLLLISLFTTREYTVSVFSYSPPSLLSIGMMDHYIHKGEGKT